MTRVEIKKFTAELFRVQSARAEMEYTIEQRLEEIARLEDHIKIQLSKEDELKEKLKGEMEHV